MEEWRAGGGVLEWRAGGGVEEWRGGGGVEEWRGGGGRGNLNTGSMHWPQQGHVATGWRDSSEPATISQTAVAPTTGAGNHPPAGRSLDSSCTL